MAAVQSICGSECFQLSLGLSTQRTRIVQNELEQNEGFPDPLEEYVERVQRKATSNVDETIEHYERTFRQWRNHMQEENRHPACPNKDHVLEFINKWKGDNKPGTVRKKIRRLNSAYEWWQSVDDFAHEKGYNPFSAAEKESDLEDSGTENKTKKPPKVELDEIRQIMEDINHIADRAIIGLQLKLGCRSSELANIKVSEVHIDHPEVREHYPELGEHRRLDGRPNAVYIHPEREHTKRKRPTVLPLDEEARRLLVDWLLVRPDTGDDWLFMTHKGNQLNRTDVRYIWTKYWWPEYEFDEEDDYRSITPHFARHRFGTYWKSDLDDINREYVKYLRGDMTDSSTKQSSDALDHYIHTYYEDVEELYRSKMYQLHV